jgi:hypothetical protein
MLLCTEGNYDSGWWLFTDRTEADYLLKSYRLVCRVRFVRLMSKVYKFYKVTNY